MVEDGGEMFGQERDRSLLLDDTVIILSQELLREVMHTFTQHSFYPHYTEEIEHKLSREMLTLSS